MSEIKKSIRRKYLEKLYKQYGDLPNDIFLQIVQYKDETMKGNAHKDLLKKLLLNAAEIKNTKNEIRQFLIRRDLVKTTNLPYYYRDSFEMVELKERLYFLQGEKHSLQDKYRYHKAKIRAAHDLKVKI